MDLQLLRLRKAAGYENRESFAEAYGIPLGTYIRWESGHRVPPIEKLWMLADIFGVSLAATHITRSIDAQGNVAPLKTAQSDRTVALSGEWAQRLLAVQDAAAAEGWRWLADDGFGAVVSQWILRSAWS